MADMYGAVRSNSFQVKDPEAFKSWFAESCNFGSETELWEESDNTFAFGGYEQYPSAWPRIWNEAECCSDEWDLDVFGRQFAQHLAEGHNLIVVSAGNEKLRYVAAQRLEVRWDGVATFDDWYAGN